MPLADRIKSLARELGFDRAGIAPAEDADGFERLGEWLARGFAGEMAYMHKHQDARRHPSSILPDVKSVVMVALNYRQTESGGPIAQYARGADYHDVIRDKLNRLLAKIREEFP